MKIFFIVGALFFLFIHPSKAGSSIETDCESAVTRMFANLLKELTPEDAERFKTIAASVRPGVIKECMSGKYKLDCLITVNNKADLQTCKK